MASCGSSDAVVPGHGDDHDYADFIARMQTGRRSCAIEGRAAAQNRNDVYAGSSDTIRLGGVRAHESLNMQLRKIIKNRGRFPTDEPPSS